MASSKTYIVEHLDEELGAWSELEYLNIAQESYHAGSKFCLSSVPVSTVLPDVLANSPGFSADSRSVENIFAADKAFVCLLDPSATRELRPEDAEIFDVFIFGGILGDDPPRDRTSELRVKGFQGRRLGPKQMTTDTAVRVTRLVIQDKKRLDEIPYVDEPEISVSKCESVSMPFRYVRGSKGCAIMPEGMLELIKEDSCKSIGNLF